MSLDAGDRPEYRGFCGKTTDDGCTMQKEIKRCICRYNLCNQKECKNCTNMDVNIDNSGSSGRVFPIITIFLYAVSIQLLQQWNEQHVNFDKIRLLNISLFQFVCNLLQRKNILSFPDCIITNKFEFFSYQNFFI